MLGHYQENREPSRTTRSLCWVLLGVCVLLGSTTGCLRRRMTINSNPPGAVVYVDEQRIGRTPVSTDFTYYGTRNIRLEMEDYETLHVQQPVAHPWYELPPFDFFSETFSAGEVKDQHTFTYNMTPKMLESDERILERANQLAEEASRSVNSDGQLGAPVQREYLLDQQRQQSPDSQWVPQSAGQTPVTQSPAAAPTTSTQSSPSVLTPAATNSGQAPPTTQPVTGSAPAVEIPAPFKEPTDTQPPAASTGASIVEPSAGTEIPPTAVY